MIGQNQIDWLMKTGQKSLIKTLRPEPKEVLDDDQDNLPDVEIYVDRSQYKSKESIHDDFKGYGLPSEDKKPIYIHAMHAHEPSTSSMPPCFDDVNCNHVGLT
jgi:hypothetical protein